MDEVQGNNSVPKHSYQTILTFIAGSLVGLEGMQKDESVTEDSLEGTNDEEGNSVGETSIPTLHGIASSSKEDLDVKHTIAHKVLCCASS